MWAARERRFEELAEIEADDPPQVGIVAEQQADDRERGRFARIALLVAVVGVEGAWLVLILYGAWQLITLLA